MDIKVGSEFQRKEPIEFSIWELFTDAWDIVSKNVLAAVGLTLLYLLVSSIVTFIPLIGPLLQLLLYPGLIFSLMRLRQSQDVSFSIFFCGFQDMNRALQLIVGQFVAGLLVLVGSIFLIVPGIYIALSITLFIYPLVLNGMNFIEAMRASYKLIDGYRWKFFGFWFAAAGIQFLGLLCVGIGVLVTTPLILIALSLFYEKLAGRSDWLVAEVPAEPEVLGVDPEPLS